MGFDKYRNYTLQLGDEQEKIINKYRSLQAQLISSPTQTKSTSNSGLKTAAQIRSPALSGRNKAPVKDKPVSASADVLQAAYQALE